MGREEHGNQSARRAVVLSRSRRYFFLRHEGKVVRGLAPRKEGDLIAGDLIEYEVAEGELVLRKVLPRYGEMMRSYGSVTKQIAANLDHLFVVTAPGTLFQPNAVDRALILGASAEVSATVVLNKSDLVTTWPTPIETIYQPLGIPVLVTSAKTTSGVDALKRYLHDLNVDRVAFIGISGVGKSSLLNALDWRADRTTGELSEKSLAGRQTTSQAFGWFVPVADDHEVCVIDLPGVQNYGLSHLSADEVRLLFPEFYALTLQCKFGDCLHVKEEACAVRSHVESGEIAKSRYESYLEMLGEIDRFKPY